ncbi:hypothetical protein FDB40_16940 [Clostridium botulinum]|nr:hypothetical protein [Clostridium botulinum]
MSKKLTKEQQLYIDKQLEFTEELYNKADEQLKEVYKAQLSNRNEILTGIANTMLSYNIADSKLAISIDEKKKLKETLSKVIKDKIQDELVNETNLTDKLLKSTGKEKYNINNYLHDIGMNVSWDIKPVDDTTLKDVINAKVEKEIWSDRLWNNKNSLQKDLKLEIDDFLNGKTSVNEIESKIKKKYNSNAYNTKRLVQDNICRVQEGINNVWQQEHNIKYVLYMATLDGHICVNCAQYDGKTFEIDKKPVEIPQHPFCRCCYTSIPNSDWRPKMRLDNETKEKINWQSYEEWHKNYIENNPKRLANEKKVKNKFSDKRQHEKYKEILGKEAPKTFDKFQELKYNNKEEWDRLTYKYKLKTVYNLDKLKHIEIFADKNVIKHILEGEVNKRGKAVGFHMENIPTKKGEIIENTRSEVNEYDIYSAKVIINGVSKIAKSTFFPTSMTPQQVVDAINEAYTNKITTPTNEFIGNTSYGFKIGMYLNNDGNITTAYPKF